MKVSLRSGRFSSLALAVVLLVAAAYVEREANLIGRIRAAVDDRSLTVLIHQGVEGVALKKVIADFARERGVSVTVIEQRYDDLYRSELAQVTGGSPGYDVIMVDDPWLPALVGAAGATGKTGLHPLTLEPAECLAWDPGDFPDPVLGVAANMTGAAAKGLGRNFCERQVPMQALPFVGNSQLFCAPRRESTDRTWQGVLRSARARRRGEQAAGGYVMRVGPGNPIVTDFLPILWAYSPTSFMSDPPRLEADAIGAFLLLEEFGKNAKADLTILSYDDFDLAVYLAQHEASMTIMWSAWAMAMASLPSQYTSSFDPKELTCGPMPQGGAPALGVWLLAIPAGLSDSRRQVAVEFVLFATGKAELVTAAAAGNPPPRRSVLQNEQLVGRFPTFGAQLVSLERATPRPRTARWRDAEQTLGACLSALYEGAINASEALDGTNDRLAALQRGSEAGAFSCLNLPDHTR